MNLPVLAEGCAGQTVASNPKLGHGDFGADPFRTRTVMDDLAPLVTLGDKDRDAESLEQALGRLGDLVQRLFGVARNAADRTQDFGAAGLALPGGVQLGQ
jgi:hypothetical protein